MTTPAITETIAGSQLFAARLAAMALFFCSGFTYAVWGVHVPIIKEKFGLSDATLAWALFSLAAGAMLTMGPIGRWIAVAGSARVCRIGAVLFALSAASIMLMPSYWLLIPALMAFGASNTVFDIAMNAQAAVLEDRYARPIMSSLHGLFSVGGIFGALAGSVWIGYSLPSWLVFALTALMIIVLMLAGRHCLLADPKSEPSATHHSKASVKKVLSMLGILSCLGLMAEGAMYDWTSMYMRDVVHSPSLWIGAGYAGFCGGMTVGRFSGDYIRSRLGSIRVLQISGMLGFVGIVLALVWPYSLPAALAFVLVGLGCSNFVPVIIATSARTKGVSSGEAIAFVGRIGYLGILLGPVFVGFTSDHAGLPTGILLIGICVLFIALAAKKIMGSQSALASPPPQVGEIGR